MNSFINLNKDMEFDGGHSFIDSRTVEYLTDIRFGALLTFKELNTHQATWLGYELVTVVPRKLFFIIYGYIYIFKRPIAKNE